MCWKCKFTELRRTDETSCIALTNSSILGFEFTHEVCKYLKALHELLLRAKVARAICFELGSKHPRMPLVL